MIVCSNCLHHNPDEAGYCEACGVQLPDLSCTNCGAPVQQKAHFCGQCGFNLRLAQRSAVMDDQDNGGDGLLPEPSAPEPMIPSIDPDALNAEPETLPRVERSPRTADSEPVIQLAFESDSESESSEEETNTRIQTQSAALLHVQSNQLMSLKDYREVIYIGKPNDRLPPDVNVAVLPNAEVVSRVHAAIHLEGDRCFVEDMGSANGTYVNDLPLMPKVKQQLRAGDRISLGKGDLVTFILQMN